RTGRVTADGESRLARARALRSPPGALCPCAGPPGGAAPLAGADQAAAVPLAVLLFLVRLLLRHGTHRAPLAAALALALVPAPAAVAAAAVGLLVHAVLALSRASAHARP
ncbi:hypothetical protein ACFV2B_20365, partial [Streptomyces lavendulae]